jgi:hypothetical protein
MSWAIVDGVADRAAWCEPRAEVDAEPQRARVVTHVLGTVRYLCLRVGHGETGAGEGIRTLDPNLGKVVLYP